MVDLEDTAYSITLLSHNTTDALFTTIHNYTYINKYVNGHPLLCRKLALEYNSHQSHTRDTEPVFLVEEHPPLPLTTRWLSRLNSLADAQFETIREVCERCPGEVSAAVDDLRYVVKCLLQALSVLHDHSVSHGALAHTTMHFKGGLSGAPLRQDGVVVLSQYGVHALQSSQRLPSNAPLRTSSVLKSALGYLPPEGIDRHGRIYVSPGMDVWALGVCLCELFGMQVVDLVSSASAPSSIFPDLLARNASVSALFTDEDLVDFLSECLTVDPRHRSTVADLMAHPFVRGMEDSQTPVLRACLDQLYLPNPSYYFHLAEAEELLKDNPIRASGQRHARAYRSICLAAGGRVANLVFHTLNCFPNEPAIYQAAHRSGFEPFQTNPAVDDDPAADERAGSMVFEMEYLTVTEVELVALVLDATGVIDLDERATERVDEVASTSQTLDEAVDPTAAKEDSKDVSPELATSTYAMFAAVIAGFHPDVQKKASSTADPQSAADPQNVSDPSADKTETAKVDLPEPDQDDTDTTPPRPRDATALLHGTSPKRSCIQIRLEQKLGGLEVSEMHVLRDKTCQLVNAHFGTLFDVLDEIETNAGLSAQFFAREHGHGENDRLKRLQQSALRAAHLELSQELFEVDPQETTEEGMEPHDFAPLSQFVRGMVWHYLLGFVQNPTIPASVKDGKFGQLSLFPCEEAELEYTKHCIAEGDDVVLDRQLEQDLPRCHQYHVLLQANGVQATMRRILKAWVHAKPGRYYWQGMDSVCAVFVVLYPQSEAAAYAGFQAFVKASALEDLYTQDNSAALKWRNSLVEKLLGFNDPELYRHLMDMGVDSSHFVIPWTLTWFAHTFPLEQVSMLWDFLLTRPRPTAPVQWFAAIVVSFLVQLREVLLRFSEFGDVVTFLARLPISTGNMVRKGMLMATTCVRLMPDCVDLVDKQCLHRPYVAGSDTTCKILSLSLNTCVQYLNSGRALLVDVRSRDAFLFRHVKGAVNVNLYHSDDDQPAGSSSNAGYFTIDKDNKRVEKLCAEIAAARKDTGKQLVVVAGDTRYDDNVNDFAKLLVACHVPFVAILDAEIGCDLHKQHGVQDKLVGEGVAQEESGLGDEFDELAMSSDNVADIEIVAEDGTFTVTTRGDDDGYDTGDEVVL